MYPMLQVLIPPRLPLQPTEYHSTEKELSSKHLKVQIPLHEGEISSQIAWGWWTVEKNKVSGRFDEVKLHASYGRLHKF